MLPVTLREHGIGSVSEPEHPLALLQSTCLCGKWTGPLDAHIADTDDLIGHIMAETTKAVIAEYKPALEKLART